MRIAIVEDDSQARERVSAFVRQYFNENERACDIRQFTDGDELLENYTADYDLIFLDIQMARLNGIAAAERIRKLDPDVFIVFITNMEHCAIKGYSVMALDFLLKPINYRVLSQLLTRAERLLREKKRRFLTLPTPKGILHFSVSDVYYIEVESHTLSVVTAQGVHTLRGTISAVEEHLADYPFFRCNNCYLVNLSQVSRIENNTVAVGGHELAISRPRRKAFMEALTDYIAGSRL
ncbi:MAG: LytTR family DNA-binding domain-containing protein [Oscillospiraceae bacterium]|jgi:DNA-binding LytR/AlgR family response regulator|nr:LytTR family DNA-binding domain-containing protein [Oscillospiraceae bacterium]